MRTHEIVLQVQDKLITIINLLFQVVLKKNLNIWTKLHGNLSSSYVDVKLKYEPHGGAGDKVRRLPKDSSSGDNEYSILVHTKGVDQPTSLEPNLSADTEVQIFISMQVLVMDLQMTKSPGCFHLLWPLSEIYSKCSCWVQSWRTFIYFQKTASPAPGSLLHHCSAFWFWRANS